MYAVIRTGGKQHKVKVGDVLEVELVHGGQDEEATFAPLLVVDDDGKTHFGKAIARAVVSAKLLGEQKGDKVKVYKYRPKTGYQRTMGHRQRYTLVEITGISLGGARAARRKAEEEPAEVQATAPAEAPADAPVEAPAEATAAATAPAEE